MPKTIIVKEDTFGEGWTKQNDMNTELYDGKLKKISVVNYIPALTAINVNTGTADYTVEGDTVSLGASSIEFIAKKAMEIKLNGIYQEKGVDVLWVSDVSFKFIVDLDASVDNIIILFN